MYRTLSWTHWTDSFFIMPEWLVLLLGMFIYFFFLSDSLWPKGRLVGGWVDLYAWSCCWSFSISHQWPHTVPCVSSMFWTQHLLTETRNFIIFILLKLRFQLKAVSKTWTNNFHWFMGPFLDSFFTKKFGVLTKQIHRIRRSSPIYIHGARTAQGARYK